MTPAMSAPIPAADTGRTTSLPERWQIYYKDYLTFQRQAHEFQAHRRFRNRRRTGISSGKRVAAASARRPGPGAESPAYSGGAIFWRRLPGSGGVPCGRLGGHGGLGKGKRRGLLSCRPTHPLIGTTAANSSSGEIRWGRRYDGIIMVKLLSDEPLFVIINSYTTGLAPSAVAYASDVVFGAAHGGKTAAGELGLPVKQSGLVLPCGATGRWTP